MKTVIIKSSTLTLTVKIIQNVTKRVSEKSHNKCSYPTNPLIPTPQHEAM